MIFSIGGEFQYASRSIRDRIVFILAALLHLRLLAAVYDEELYVAWTAGSGCR